MLTISPQNPVLQVDTTDFEFTVSGASSGTPTVSASVGGITFSDPSATQFTVTIGAGAPLWTNAQITFTDGEGNRVTTYVFIVPDDWADRKNIFLQGTDGNVYLLTEEPSGPPAVYSLAASPDVLGSTTTSSVVVDQVSDQNAQSGYCLCYVLNMAQSLLGKDTQ